MPEGSGGPQGPGEFEELFEQAPCGYLTTSGEGRITRVNQTFLTWSGYRRGDLLGSAFSRLLPVGDRILWSTHSSPLLGTAGTVSEVVVEIVGADGARRPALVTATRVPGPEAGETRIVVFSAPERRAHERQLIAALHRAEESEDRRAAAEAEGRRRTLRDPLTGLLNRAGLTRHLNPVPVPVGDRADLAVLVVDLDHFSLVNESLGAAAGDELLRAVTSRLSGLVREGAVLARSSADEFVVVDRCEDLEGARRLAERLLEALTVPVVLAGLEVVTSASIGVAVASAAQGSAQRALHDAGVARQRAKARGRRRVEVHDASCDGAAADRLRLLGELRRGIGAGQLRLEYQPQVRLGDADGAGGSAGTGGVGGVEALVRWQHPVRGLLGPDAFIDLAEESGLVHELGAWVLDEAVAQAARWARDPDCVTVAVSVNLSTRQLTGPGLVEAVTSALSRHRLPAHLLALEVTETALAADPEVATATLTALAGLGVVLSVDDFGTGYASLTYLQRFPVDELKIDRSFVAGLGVVAGDTAIVQACVQLAHAVGVRAVAEGVETLEQHRTLGAMGCDVGQGFLYSRSLAPQALQQWLRRHENPPGGSPGEWSPAVGRSA